MTTQATQPKPRRTNPASAANGKRGGREMLQELQGKRSARILSVEDIETALMEDGAKMLASMVRED